MIFLEKKNTDKKMRKQKERKEKVKNIRGTKVDGD